MQSSNKDLIMICVEEKMIRNEKQKMQIKKMYRSKRHKFTYKEGARA